MHPIFARSRRLGLYLLLFLQAGALLGELLAQSTSMSRPLALLVAIPVLLLHSFSCLASWYLCRSLPLGGDRPGRPVLALAAAATLAAGLLLALADVWARALGEIVPAAGAEVREGLSQGRFLVFVFGLLIFSLVAVVHYLFIIAEERRAAVARALEMRIQAREAELRALRAQINPHFLFNSLNSISSLVTADPAQARKMCIRLADFLRQSLRFGARDSISVRQEVELMASYLEVERFRFGNRLRPSLQVGEDCSELQVPPLILQPLVENAVGHGIGQLLEGGSVEIEVRCREEHLQITVENDCEARPSSKRGEGIGLENVRQRLAARYGDRAGLKIEAPWVKTRASEASQQGQEIVPPGRPSTSRFRATVSLPASEDRE